MVKIEINKGLARRVPETELKQVARVVVKYLQLRDNFLVSLGFVGAPEIKKMNRLYRGKSKVTDVLSFADGELVTLDTVSLGEIIICYPQAVVQAKEHRQTIAREIVTLFLHGLLHLLGFDHEEVTEAEVMEELEAVILKKIKK